MGEPLKVGVSGVRGVVGESFNPQNAAAFGQAFGTFVGGGDVVVGRDTRPTGPMIERAVVAGLQSVGCRPLLAGVVPTPTVLHLVCETGARGGIAITASHNPVRWNALKFADRKGIFLDATRAGEFFDIYHQQDFPLVKESELRPVEDVPRPTAKHFGKVLSYVQADAIRQAGFKVAVDCCNGVGAIHTVRFLSRLFNCEVVAVHDEPSGIFEREPEPLPQHLQALGEAVVRQGCAVGFAQDPDGDRLAIVDEQGHPIGEDLSLALVAQQVLEHHEQGPVVCNQSASKAVEHAAQPAGADVLRAPTGEINVVRAMLDTGAVVGGENSGGVIVPAVHPCRDSYVAMALVLERMALTGRSITALRSGFPRYHLIKEKHPVRAEQASGILRAVRRHFEGERISLIDGVYVDFGDRWIQVRRSNTEPVIRLIVEAADAEAAEALAAPVRVLVSPRS